MTIRQGLIVLFLLLACVVYAETKPSTTKKLTATEKSLLFWENGLQKDHYFGYTPLILSAMEGREEAVRKILKDEKNVNWKMEWGYTALMLAADQGHAEIVNLLLASGADPNLKNEDGLTAQMLAEREGRTEVVKILEKQKADHDSANR